MTVLIIGSSFFVAFTLVWIVQRIRYHASISAIKRFGGRNTTPLVRTRPALLSVIGLGHLFMLIFFYVVNG